MMPRPLLYREAFRHFRQAATGETTLRLKQLLVSHALVMAQLAEMVERDAAGLNNDTSENDDASSIVSRPPVAKPA